MRRDKEHVRELARENAKNQKEFKQKNIKRKNKKKKLNVVIIKSDDISEVVKDNQVIIKKTEKECLKKQKQRQKLKEKLGEEEYNKTC